MKRILFAVMVFAALAFNSNADNSFSRGRFNAFYNDLRAHGYWMEIDNVVVWKPSRVRSNWQPYTYGRWIYTSYGWFWDSDEAFGDIVFHYGRWYYDNWEGWVWVPGYEWAPAWVEWRYDDDYIGWAPLSPYATFNRNYGISFTINIVIPVNQWRFVRIRDFHRHNIYDYYFSGYGADRCYERTQSFSNYKYRDRVVNEGIDPRILEKRGGGNVKTRDIDFTNAKDRGNNKSDGSVKIRNIDLNRTADRNDEKIEITKTRNNGSLKSDKVDESAREITREVKNNTNTRNLDKKDDTRTVTRNDKTVTRDNSGNTSREVKREDNKPVTRDNTSREVKREDNKPVTRDNSGSTARETKRDNTVRETPKRDTTPRNTDRGNSGSTGGSKERKSR
ncbi:hypothetical protein MASR1M107_18570 [Ignavibacteriales bacterium]